MTDSHTCPYCSYPIGGESVTLWDGRVYCRKCVERASPELYQLAASGAPLEETVTGEDVRAWRYFRHWYGWYAIVVLAIFGSMSALVVATGEPPIVAAFILTFFLGGGALHQSLVSWRLARLQRRWLPRTSSISDGKLLIDTPERDANYELSECTWSVGSARSDDLSLLCGLNHRVMVTTTGGDNGLGLGADSMRLWQAFFTLAGVRRRDRVGYLAGFATFVAGLAIGALIGSLVGLVVAGVFGDERWIPGMAAFVGIEIALFALVYRFGVKRHMWRTRSRGHWYLYGLHASVCLFGDPLVIMRKCGVQWGVGDNISAVNLVVGFPILTLLAVRLRALDQQRELTDQMQRGRPSD